MSLRRRLFITLSVLVVLGFLAIARWVKDELRDSYSQVVEEMLVDFSHLASAQLENSRMSPASFEILRDSFKTYKTHIIDASIFDFIKVNSSLELYVTDARGIVVFSTVPEEVGQDFSRWNDVYKTLRGEYGARSTRTDPDDLRTSVYFVAAPIRIDGQIAGTVTVYKTESSVLLFLDRAIRKMFIGGLFAVIALGLIGGLIMIWITLPLERLRRYAINVSEDRRAVPPHSKIKEVRHLTEAFEKMRVSLEGKKTVEKFTQTLTHELKSPLTAIKGAAELCQEEMDRGQQKRFLKNIIDEAHRAHSLLEQLLKIAALETRRNLEVVEPVDVIEVLNETKDALLSLWHAKNLEIVIEANGDTSVSGDRLLLFQAFRNLLQNAIEFSYRYEKIKIEVTSQDRLIKIAIHDRGTGIPHFAKDRIFEKFYSLERPDTQRKSSGLGLSFVKEVVELHDGAIELAPGLTGHGTTVTVALPSV